MPGIGPRAQPQPEPAHGLPDADLEAAAALAHQFFLDGQASVTQGGYQAGHDLAFDVGYGARNDNARSFVAGALEGHAAGLAARYELQDAAKAGTAPAGGQTQLPEPEPEPEPELEAG
jgi:hypothetical protein